MNETRRSRPLAGHSARYILSRALRKMGVSLKGSPTALVFIGPLSFCGSLRIELLPVRPIFQPGGNVGGLRVRATVLRNRFASPLALAEFDILEEKGIHHEAELFDVGYAVGVIERLSPGFVYGREFLGKSRERAIAALEQHRGLAERLEEVLVVTGELPTVPSGDKPPNYVAKSPLHGKERVRACPEPSEGVRVARTPDLI